ncbi:MAG: hypothetical protein K5697_05085, partial [Lachnospiraceae bacterium]|nr:hypothetical protein [Lachnospiraceae bacterium]
MKNRKLQRVLTWILTLTMILGTFGETGFAVKAAEPDEEIEVSPEEADVPDPDQYTADATVTWAFGQETVQAAEDGTNNVAFVETNGYKIVDDLQANGTNAATKTKTYDSEFGTTFYVVPKIGYTFNLAADKTAKDVFTVTGGWRYKDQDAVVLNGTTDAFTAEFSPIEVADD